MSCRKEDRQFILEFIRLYRDFPCLWKVKDDEYMNRQKKSEAYDVLLAKFTEKYSNATVEDVKKKINVLRTNFRKELKKILDSKKSGAGMDDVYDTSLWYFEEMNFLVDQETPSQSISTLSDSPATFTLDSQEDNDEDGDNCISEGTSTPSPTTSSIRPRKRKQTPHEELISLACKHLSQPEDEFYHQAKTWADDLSKMERSQMLYAKKAINDIIFEGQMGNLSRNSIEINRNSQPTTTSSNTVSNQEASACSSSKGANIFRNPQPITIPANSSLGKFLQQLHNKPS